MKLKNLLLISFCIVVWVGCDSKYQKKENRIIEKKVITTYDTLIDAGRGESLKKNITIIEPKESIQRKEKSDTLNPKLKVVVEGKVYFKKNIGDYKYDNLLYQFYDVKEHKDYDIRTGKYFPGPALWETGVLETDQ